jgi:oligopeptide transport system substrate-binding protein
MNFRILLLSLVGLVLVGCPRRDDAAAKGTRDAVLHVGIGSEPAELDPALVTGLGEGMVVPALFDPLLTLDPATHQPAPALAEKWDVSADGTVYTFHLRAGAGWSNGEPITAQDCVDSWKRVLSPTLAADNAYLLYVVRGAEDFHRGRTTDPATLGLEAKDERTFVVTLARPTTYFPLLLVNPTLRPVNLRAVAANGDPAARGNRWTRPGKMVTSGPFTLKDWSPNQRIIVEKSETHWNRDRIRLAAVHFYPIDSVNAEERAFRSGQIHVTYGIPLAKIATYREQKAPELRTDPQLDTFLFRFNTERAPLDKPAVRRALSLAIDRQALATQILKGGQQPAATVVHPETPDYTPPPRPLMDAAAAREILWDAGFPEGRNFPPIEILHNNSDTLRLIAEGVQEMWRRELGIAATIRNQELKVVFADRRAGSYQVLLSDWIGDYLDATTFLDVWRSDSSNNHTRWKNAEYDALLNRAATTADRAARAALLQQAETLMLDEAPIAPLYFNPHVYLIHPSVKGWQPALTGSIDYQHVSLQPAAP